MADDEKTKPGETNPPPTANSPRELPSDIFASDNPDEGTDESKPTEPPTPTTKVYDRFEDQE